MGFSPLADMSHRIPDVVRSGGNAAGDWPEASVPLIMN